LRQFFKKIEITVFMNEKQKTLKNTISFEGTGLHTGQHVQVNIKPAPENTGYVFIRSDLDEKPTIHAHVNNVIMTSRGTTLEENGARVGTIEHLLAALYGMKIDNVYIEINGPEVPILDGSSRKYVETILETGIQDQEAEKDYIEVKEPISFKDEENQIEITAIPDDHFHLNVLIDYDSKVLGNQYATISNLEDFQNQIAPCRTFVFFHELEYLFKNNLIKGGDLENAIVIMEQKVPQEELDRMAELFNKPKVKVKPNGILNNLELQYTNEPARHKLLDFIGDIALIGKPLKGRFLVSRPGHRANTEFAKKLLNGNQKERGKNAAPVYDRNKEPLININQIMEILPHRPPFLLVDKILEMSDTYIIGLKNVSMNEGFFVGHFPDEPIMPGVLQVEAMAQVGGILVLNTVPDPENYLTYFLKIENAKFKRKVVPGDTILFQLELKEPIRRGIVSMHGKAFVGDTVVMEGDMMAQIVKVKN
jgi:UDP-3-O-[3-hydroxymyristoyl] N-acetylglucosamine deacetylase/3-hydroxyacyl-[acyl-carrier-protein] dehydratase